MAQILRRPEYKRRRKYKARARKRNPLNRILRDFTREVYVAFRTSIFPRSTPFLAQFERKTGSVPTDNYAGHLAEGAVHPDGTEVVPVHSGDSGRAPSRAFRWGGNGTYFDVVAAKAPAP